MAADLLLLPWIEARRLLGDRAVTLRTIVPPYAAVGGGAFRVLRVRDNGAEPLEIACGYERYDRL